MADVIITEALLKEIEKQFTKHEANEIIDSFEELAENPHKGKILTSVAGIVIKELKRDKHRFYCITDGHTLKFGSADELATLIIKFVRLSEKKDQQKVLDEIKDILKQAGFEGFPR